MKKDDMVNKTTVTISKDELESKDWIKKYLKDYYLLYDEKKYNILKNTIRLSCKILSETDKKVYTDCIGWVKGNAEWHYVPSSCNNKKKDIFYMEELESKYKIKTVGLSMDETESSIIGFKETINMLDVLDKTITLPLLSYCILSSNLTFIKSQNLTPDTYLNIFGINDQISNVEVANIFSNIYRKTDVLQKLDYEYHLKIEQEEKEIVEKLSIMRDCVVFVTGIDSSKKEHIEKVRKIIGLSNKKEIAVGVIFLSNSYIESNSILNLDITNKVVAEDILIKCRESLNIFSNFYINFIDDMKKHIEDRNVVNFKKRYMKMLDNTSKKVPNSDINEIRKISWLKIAYKFIAAYGYNIKNFSSEIEEDNFIKSGVEILNLLYITIKKDSNPCIEDKMITSLLECLKNLIESSKISQNYDEYSKDENESFGWQDKEYYILKYRETNKYLQDYVKKSGDCISNKDMHQLLYENKIIDRQIESDGRIRYDINKGNNDRKIYIYKDKIVQIEPNKNSTN